MIIAIVVAALITFLLRFIPVQLASRFSPKGTMAQVTAYLPTGVMLILVAYTFLEAESSQQALRLGIGAVVALLLELKYRNTLLSFVAGLIVFSVTGLFL